MSSNESSLDPDVLARLVSLDDPVRRRLYEFVLESDQPTGRDQAATAAEISRALAAYHLDKLVDAGLLRAAYARPPGRSGPGAGRPAKVYSRADGELALSVPPRDYELLGKLLVASIDHDPTGTVREAVNQAAYEAGQQAFKGSDGNLMAILRGCDYQPKVDGDGLIELRNCPFHALAQEHRDAICGLNLRLIQGVLDGGDEHEAEAKLVFRPGRCCVTIHNTKNAASATRNPTGNAASD